MDTAMAERLASSSNPKDLATLAGKTNDQAAAKAVAEQFGAFLMQGMMQQSDGSGLGMASGVGGATVNSMFASAMGRVAMSGDKLGLADVLLRSMEAKQSVASGSPAAASAPSAATTATPTTAAIPPAAAAAMLKSATTIPPAAAAALGSATNSSGFPLAPYWLGNGMRPIGAGTGTGHAITAAPNQPNPVQTPAALKATPAANGAAAPAAAPAAGATAAPTATGAAASAPQLNAAPPPTIAHAQLAPPTNLLPPNAAAAASSPAATSPSTSAPDSSSAAAVSPPADITNFVNQIAPSLQQAAAQLGVSPKILLAQAALETGWGHSVVGNNVFGVKAGSSWSGSVIRAATHETQNGQTVAREANFRSYPSVTAAAQDFASLISQNSRYRGVVGAGDDVAAYARGLASGGYATDRAYAAKLQAVAASPALAAAIAALPSATSTQLASAQE